MDGIEIKIIEKSTVITVTADNCAPQQNAQVKTNSKTNNVEKKIPQKKATIACLNSYPSEDFIYESKPFAFHKLEKSERIKRIKWLRKVFSISTVQLFFSFIWSLLLLSENVRKGFQNYITHLFLLTIGAILLLLLLLVKDINTTFPVNFIFSGIYAICQGHLFSLIGIYSGAWISILINFYMFIFSLGMTIYVWIVKQQYYYTVSYLLSLILFFISSVIAFFILTARKDEVHTSAEKIRIAMFFIISIYFYMSIRIMNLIAHENNGYMREDTFIGSMYLFASFIIVAFVLVFDIIICGSIFIIIELFLRSDHCLCCESTAKWIHERLKNLCVEKC